MKTLRIHIDRWLECQDKRWRALPLNRQRRYTLYLFFGYLLLTAAVIFQICLQVAESNSEMAIEHIENPALKNKVP